MRRSIRKNDPGYDPLAYQYEVFFNGTKIENCFTADEEKGEAWVHVITGKGPHAQQHIECLSGEVHLQLGESGCCGF